jgi:hypothetical protein
MMGIMKGDIRPSTPKGAALKINGVHAGDAKSTYTGISALKRYAQMHYEPPFSSALGCAASTLW